MGRSLTTRPSLLLRIRDAGDRQAWAEFVEIYAPLIYGYARRRGLQDADAADLLQDVLAAVAGAARRFDYDADRGSFRGWVLTVTRRALHHLLDRRRRQPRGTGDTGVAELLEEQPDRDEEREGWDREHRQRVFAWAAHRVRRETQPPTWEAFWRTAVEGRPAPQVAAELGMPVGAVYTARCRVLDRVKAEARWAGID